MSTRTPKKAAVGAVAQFTSLEDAARFLWLTAGWKQEELEAVRFMRVTSEWFAFFGVVRDASLEATADAVKLARVGEAAKYVMRHGTILEGVA